MGDNAPQPVHVRAYERSGRHVGSYWRGTRVQQERSSFAPIFSSDALDNTFTAVSDDFGIPYAPPALADGDVYEETYDDGSKFWRFEQLEELFSDFDRSDERAGYDISHISDVLYTLQQRISPTAVREYDQQDNPFAHRLFPDSLGEDTDDQRSSHAARIVVLGTRVYIADGNHRIISALRRGKTSMYGIVVYAQQDDTGHITDLLRMSPDVFNRWMRCLHLFRDVHMRDAYGKIACASDPEPVVRGDMLECTLRGRTVLVPRSDNGLSTMMSMAHNGYMIEDVGGVLVARRTLLDI